MNESKIIGKTYSLYGEKDRSDFFYDNLADITNQILQNSNNAFSLLKF